MCECYGFRQEGFCFGCLFVWYEVGKLFMNCEKICSSIFHLNTSSHIISDRQNLSCFLNKNNFFNSFQYDEWPSSFRNSEGMKYSYAYTLFAEIRIRSVSLYITIYYPWPWSTSMTEIFEKFNIGLHLAIIWIW